MRPAAPDAPPEPPWRALLHALEGLAGKTVLVTGASSGIGREVALAMAAAGARVGLAARRRSLLEAVAEEIGAGGGRAVVVPTDVTEASQVHACFAALEREAGTVDVVVNNAGVIIPGAVVDVREADLDRMLRVNLVGALPVMQEAMRRMRTVWSSRASSTPRWSTASRTTARSSSPGRPGSRCPPPGSSGP